MDDIAAKDPGDDFEQAFWGLLRRRYKPEQLVYIPATMGGDYGIEGYSTDGIAYQCYSDRDSLTLRHRTDKQKAKLLADTSKLKKYASKLEAILDGTNIEHYFLVVPEYHAAELITYANSRAKAVREYNLGFISKTFAIRLKTFDDYPAELAAAIMDGAAQAVVSVPEVGDNHVNLFSEETPELARVLEGKLGILNGDGVNRDIPEFRDRLIRAFLKKDIIMRAMRDWPDTWEAIERQREAREEKLEIENDLVSSAPNQRILDLVREYQEQLETSVAGLRQIDAQRLAYGQIGEWLMRCPLRLRASS